MPEKLHFVTFNINVMKKMSCSSESDFETNSFEKDESQEFSGEKKNCLTVYGKGFLISWSIISNQKKKKMLKKL